MSKLKASERVSDVFKMEANETFDTVVREVSNQVISDTDDDEGEHESPAFHEETDSEDIPQSLLSYFKTSKSRAAVCEKLILEDLEDFTASHPTEDTVNFPCELDTDTVKPNEQVVCERNTSTDTRLLSAPTGTEILFSHNEDEFKESERQFVSEYEAERRKRHREEMKKEEKKRQIERDFQTELKKITEAEKLHQKELELIGKRAQETLEQELLLQQELISNLRRRVEEERRMREEEQKKRRKDEEDKRMREEENIKMEAERKRMEEEMRRKKEEQKRRKDEEEKRMREEEKIKIEAERKRMEEEMRRKKEEQKRREDEEEKRTREEEKIKIEAERKRMEEEMRRKKEEERKIEEMKLKKEEERKHEEEEKRRVEREEKRKREEERNKMEMEKKKLEDKMRMMKEEEERKQKLEEEKRKREEERQKIEEEAKKKVEKEKRKIEEDMSQKEEEKKKREEENMRIEEEVRITKEIEERKKQEEMRKKKEEEEMHEEMRKRDEKQHGNVDEEVKLKERKKKEETDRKRREEEEARNREKETKATKEKKELTEVVRTKEGEDRKMKEEPRPMEEDEKRKREDERKIKEEERRRRLKEDLRQDEEECYRKSEEEIKLKEDEEGYKRFEVDNRKVEHERKHVETEKEMKEEEVGENKKEIHRNTEEEVRLKEKEESKQRVMHDGETEGRANEPQEKIENNRTSSRTGPLHSESTISRSSTEVKPQQHDPEESISRISTDKTVDSEDQAATTASVLSSVFLPEHTEEKRLAWMRDCVPWSKLSLQNRSKRRGPARSRRGPRGAAGSGGLTPLCPDSLLRSTGWTSLQEVTTVTLEDLPGRGLSTLAQCTRLRSLTLRRCGLKSLEGVNQLPQLCYIDVQENDISFVDCENMSSLRVLHLGHNKLTSIHGLTGAENVDVLDLSHNSITRIAGLESTRRLQRLSVDHNQLISTKGLRDVYTLLHLSCSHNHLVSVEGLESSALLHTLDLRGNSLTEPPSLNNQVLLRELHLDDNSISSLQGLAACWLPLMQHLSVAQNRITQLPPMSDSVSLANLDLRFNCMSELQNVCESLEGCVFLRELHLTGNPLQQERGWRSSLQRAVPGLRAVDDQQTLSALTPPAAQRVSPASGSFLDFCQAQLQQTRGLQQRHSRELSSASSSLDAVKTSCRHLTEVLQLAEDQRFAHEYGDTTVADTHRAAGRTTPEEVDSDRAEERAERTETESAGKAPPVLPNRRSYWTLEEKSAAESRRDTFDPECVTVSKAVSGCVHSSATEMKTTSSNLEVAPASNSQDLDLQNTAAVVIQQLWRKYRQKCGNIGSLSTAEKGGGRRGGDGGEPESGPPHVKGSVVGPDYAATVIQACWRGFVLRRRLASALAAVTRPDGGEDDTFEEVDVDEFVFDEAALEKPWTFTEDVPPRRHPASEQPLSPKPPGHFPEPSQFIIPVPSTLVWRPKQAWLPGEQVDSAGQRVSPESSNRSKSPASTSVLSGLSERSEKILEEWGFTDSHTALLMLKRAQNMKSKTQRQMKRKDPSVHLAFGNCSYPLGPVAARNMSAQHNRSDLKGREAEPGHQRAEKVEKVERVKRERAQQWLRTQAAHPDRDPESVRFLPEISSDVLNGGRVQLVADPGHTARPHHASGSRANDSSPCKEHNYPRRDSFGPARNEVPSPQRVFSAPSRRERISFRDNPVQWSGGWGGGKKRDKVCK